MKYPVYFAAVALLAGAFTACGSSSKQNSSGSTTSAQGGSNVSAPPPVGKPGTTGGKLSVELHPFGFGSRDNGDGYTHASFNLYYINTQSRPVSGFLLYVNSIVVLTEEGKSYPQETLPIHNSRTQKNSQYYLPIGVPDEDPASIPTHLPIWKIIGHNSAGTGAAANTASVSMIYASAAHPTKVVIATKDYGTIEWSYTDLKSATKDVPEPSGLNLQPLAVFAKSLNVDNPKYAISVDPRCERLDDVQRYTHGYVLNYSIINKDGLAPVDIPANGPDAFVLNNGTLFPQNARVGGVHINPGQTQTSQVGIDLAGIEFKVDGKGLLITTDSSGHTSAYKLDCT